jgi:hypothetical protein
MIMESLNGLKSKGVDQVFIQFIFDSMYTRSAGLISRVQYISLFRAFFLIPATPRPLNLKLPPIWEKVTDDRR